MKGLKLKVAQIIIYGYFDGLTYAQIASYLNKQPIDDVGVKRYSLNHVHQICKYLRFCDLIPEKRHKPLLRTNRNKRLAPNQNKRESVTREEILIQLLKKYFKERKSNKEIASLLSKNKIKNHKGKDFNEHSIGKYCKIKIAEKVLPNRESVSKVYLRNQEIAKMARSGKSTVEIAKIFKLARATVTSICKEAGCSKREMNQVKFKPIVDKYNELLKGDCFYGVTKQIREDGYNIAQLQSYGLKYSNAEQTEKRNKKIAKAYQEGKTADEILDGGVCGISSREGFFGAIRGLNVNKHPGIERGKKGLFEDRKLIRRIIVLREKRRLSFREITEIIKKEGYLSITGKEILEPQISYKYNKYNKLHRHNKPEKFRAKKKNKKKLAL